MKRADLRQNLIKTKLNNRSVDGSYEDESFVTEDFVYLPNENDLSSFGSVDYILGMSDLVTDETSQIGSLYTASGKKSGPWLIRDGKGNFNAYDEDGRRYSSDEVWLKSFGIHPCFRYKVPDVLANQILLRMTDISKRNSITIEDNWGLNGKTKPYYVLNVGEGPIKKVNDTTSFNLEKLYSSEKSTLECTGRWFSVNGNYNLENGENVALKHLPEFKYKGKRYVRKSSASNDLVGFSSKSSVDWYEVTPITYIIKNWDKLPKTINPLGTGEENFFDLISELSLFRNLPFHTNENNKYCMLWQNSVPRAFLNGINTNNITENGNPEYGSTGGANCIGKCNFIEESLNLTREPIVEYKIEDGIEEIADTAFEGCRSLKKLTIPASVKKIGKDAFKGLSFKYMYRLNNGDIVFDQVIPLDKSNIEKVIDLEKDIDEMNKVLIGVKSKISLEMLASKDGSFEKIEEYYKKMSRLKMPISYTYLKKLEDAGLLNDFLSNNVFKFFRNENADFIQKLQEYPDEEVLDFYKFAYVLGCFSKEKVKDSDGKETETSLAQKASSKLYELLKGKLPLGKYHGLFDSLPLDIKPEQKVLKFLSDIVDDKNTTKLDLILRLENDGCPNLFVKILSNFKNVDKLRQEVNKKTGAQEFISWEDTFKKFYRANKYDGITKENADIAEVYGRYGVSQYYFDEATSLRKQAKARDIPEHIAGREVKEETVLESIEKIRNSTQGELEDSKNLIEGLYKKLFTYEWLNKNDPQNGILGLMCSCCATLMSEHYGRHIAEKSITAPDLQNLVVRNSEGDIIAKGAVYVNKEKGYAVVNDFEMSLKYREDEDMESSGRYLRTDTRAEERRQLIFDAFVRGIEDFVKAYEEEYPDRPPISQVNVGWGLNRLKNQVEKLERATKDLSVPLEYHFEDSTYKQYVLYKKDVTKQKSREDKVK